jgi:mannitol-1-phosphate 5-dehydrogenase
MMAGATMKTALQFGAGNIGRGFMGQLFFEAGYRTVFVEYSQALVDAINELGRYPLRLLDAYRKRELEMTIGNIEALSSTRNGQVADAFARADVVGTAVGVENLAAIAPLLAEGIRRRQSQGGGPLDVYLCENAYGAAATLKQAVEALLDDGAQGWADSNVGFVGTSVARMVPAPSERFKGIHPLFVVADSYHSLPYDGRATKAPPPPIEGMTPVANFEAEVTRKLYTHNLGHAALGYLGFLKGHTYVHEAYADGDLRRVFTRALRETAQALVKRYPHDIDAKGHEEILKDVGIRFSNPLIMDAVTRVARDPLRKLGPDDRLIGSARLCLSLGIVPETIARVCAAAYCYAYAGDPAAVKLQAQIQEHGICDTLRNVSGVDPESSLGERIVAVYRELSASSPERARTST